MKKGALLVVILSVILIFGISGVYAAVTIEPPASVYNIGDDFTLTLKVTQSSATQDFLIVDLICPNNQLSIYKTPLYITAGEQRSLVIPMKLDKLMIDDLRGLCHLEAIYAGATASSSSFEISEEIIPSVILQDFGVDPDEVVYASGTAIKKNGKQVNGFVEISIPELELESSSPVKNGNYRLNVSLPSSAAAGTYIMNVYVYEQDMYQEIINSGLTTTSLTVNQLVKSVDIALSNSEISPPLLISYTPLVYDQTNQLMDEDITVIIYNPSGNMAYKRLLHSGVSQQFDFLSNATPGIWQFEATHGAVKQRKQITVNDMQNASFVLNNGTLTVTNIGNVPYQKTLDILIGDTHKIYSVFLEMGEMQRLRLFAPEGSYPVSISEGNSSVSLGSVFLTGKAVDVKDADRFEGVYPWLWWIVALLIVACFVLYYYRKIRRRSYWGREPSLKTENLSEPRKINKLPTLSESNKSVGVAATPKKNMTSSEEGKKTCAVIALHIKNTAQLESAQDSSAQGAIASIIEQARNAGANLYHQGAYRLLIIPEGPSKEAGLIAARTALDIKKALSDYNQRYALKIAFGIGVHIGQMIVESHEGRLRFTSVGTTVVGAKKLAEHANGNILLGEDMHRMTVGKVKTQKSADRQWSLESIPRRNQESEFIKRFMQRNS